MKKNLMDHLLSYSGSFEGDGINHEGQPFIGKLELKPIIQSKGFEILFSAQGANGTPYHEEKTWVAFGPNEKPALWSINSNNPMVLQHELRRDGKENSSERTLVFGAGDPADQNAFREEIAIDLFPDGDLAYRYSWGLPGGEFQARSQVRMKPGKLRPIPDTQALDIWHVAVPVSSLDASVKFYRDQLGFKLLGFDEYDSKKQAFVAVSDGKFTVELFEPKGEYKKQPAKLPDHLAFECRDVEAYRSEILSRGIEQRPEIKSFDTGTKVFSLKDPDGVSLEFFQGRKIYEEYIATALIKE